MAIIPGIPGLEVSILVDGQPLPEYEEEDESDSVPPGAITRFVESRAGSNFSIQIKFGRNFLYASDDSIVMNVFLDGWYATGLHMNKVSRTTHPTKQMDGALFMEDGVWKEAKFRFADLFDGRESGTMMDLHTIKNLGSIQLRCFRALSVGGSAREPTNPRLGKGSITEQKLKGSAVTHRVRLLEPEIIEPAQSMHCTYPFGKKPFAEFNFQYRSRQSLQSSLLIPRTPSPIPLESRDPANLTREELQELVRIQKVKQERMERNVVIKKEIKREHAEIGEEDEDDDEVVVIAKRAKIIETIDLTED